MKRRLVNLPLQSHSAKPVDGQIRATDTDKVVRTALYSPKQAKK